MSVTKNSSWKSFDLNRYTSAKMSWKNAREWKVSLYCYRSQALLCISNVCFAFLLLLTAFYLRVLHDGFRILTIAELEKWQALSIVNEKQQLFRYYQAKFFLQVFLWIYMIYRLHLYILYTFVLCCVRRFSCLVGKKVKVCLLSALVLLLWTLKRFYEGHG